MQFWIQDTKPSWLPEGFQVPNEMLNKVQELTKEAENVYYQVDTERNGFLRRKEFKKAMKKLGINKYEAKHMLIFVDQERLKVVSIKNYVNSYLFIQSGGLNHINTDYQGPITSVVDQRTHMNNTEPERIPFDMSQLSKQLSNISFLTQNVFQSIPRPKNIVGYYQTMQAANGMYLCSENGRLIANRPVIGPWEKFFLHHDSSWGVDGRALKTVWNKYICCEIDNTAVDNRTAVGPWEIFKQSIPDDGGQSMERNVYKSWTGRYLTTDTTGNVSFGATSIGTNEIWICKVVSAVYI